MLNVFVIMIVVFVFMALYFMIKIKKTALQIKKTAELNNQENKYDKKYQFIKGLF